MLSPLETLIHTHSNKHHGFVLLTFLCSLNFESFCYVGDCRYSALQIYRIVLRVCLIFYSKTGVKQKAWQDAFNLWIESHVHEEDEENAGILTTWHLISKSSEQVYELDRSEQKHKLRIKSELFLARHAKQSSLPLPLGSETNTHTELLNWYAYEGVNPKQGYSQRS